MKLKKCSTIILLTCFFVSCNNKANTQDTISIKQGDYEFKQTSNPFGRTKAFAKPGNSILPKGLYKAAINEMTTIFNVTDSGYLQGEKRVFTGTKLQSISNWNNGEFIREYFYSYDSGRLLEESFDSTATVYLYDSITNNWNSKLRRVRVRKEFSMIKGGESDWRMVFREGETRLYALFSFRNGKMIGKTYLDHFYEQYNSDGALVMNEIHNWKLKQREITSFTDSTKTIIRDKKMSWNKDGSIGYQPVGELGEDMQTEFYKAGKLIKKVIFKNNTQTIFEYDKNGKIKSKEIYNLPKVRNETQPPV